MGSTEHIYTAAAIYKNARQDCLYSAAAENNFPPKLFYEEELEGRSYANSTFCSFLVSFT